MLLQSPSPVFRFLLLNDNVYLVLNQLLLMPCGEFPSAVIFFCKA